MQVLHSKGLVNWRIIGQVFNRLSMAPKYDEMKGYSQGTWAPALRYHDGEFYIFVCTPSDGLFMWHAKNPAGPWSETVTVRAVPRWEHACPFWDDDGRAYLIHSQVGAGPLILHRMSSDGTQLLDEGKEIYRGPVAEGLLLYFLAGGRCGYRLADSAARPGHLRALRAEGDLPQGQPSSRRLSRAQKRGDLVYFLQVHRLSGKNLLPESRTVDGR
jgi:hypothetical protein